MARVMVDFSGDVVRRRKLPDAMPSLRSAKPEPEARKVPDKAKKEKAAKPKERKPMPQPAPKKSKKRLRW